EQSAERPDILSVGRGGRKFLSQSRERRLRVKCKRTIGTRGDKQHLNVRSECLADGFRNGNPLLVVDRSCERPGKQHESPFFPTTNHLAPKIRISPPESSDLFLPLLFCAKMQS